MSGAELVHASAVAMRRTDGWRAVVMRGPSGAGKSGLALTMIQQGWRLVGDDYVWIWTSGGALHVRGDPRIAGRLEARGVGLIAAPPLALARVALVLDPDDSPERLPAPRHAALAGGRAPCLALDYRDPATPAKIASCVSALSSRDALA